jgi:uncharacterized protein (UPF0276 family)
MRIPHYQHIFSERPSVDFFEIISENFMAAHGIPRYNLDRALETYPVVLHGVCLSIGASAPLDWDYLNKLKALVRHTQTPWATDHLCWTRDPQRHYHDLLPLPYTQETLGYVAERARIVQDFLEVPFGLENLSSILEFASGTMQEWDFFADVVDKADCGMLLDINNIYVSARNHGFDPQKYLDSIDYERVLQFHLAGHSDYGHYVLDTHDHPVRPEVHALFCQAYEKSGGVSTLLEWDDHIPPFEETRAELLKAKAMVVK